ncbi:hypothetical protein D3C80_2007800 [compost metagenome]
MIIASAGITDAPTAWSRRATIIIQYSVDTIPNTEPAAKKIRPNVSRFFRLYLSVSLPKVTVPIAYTIR